jgi:hypothetical protein
MLAPKRKKDLTCRSIPVMGLASARVVKGLRPRGGLAFPWQCNDKWPSVHNGNGMEDARCHSHLSSDGRVHDLGGDRENHTPAPKKNKMPKRHRRKGTGPEGEQPSRIHSLPQVSQHCTGECLMCQCLCAPSQLPVISWWRPSQAAQEKCHVPHVNTSSKVRFTWEVGDKPLSAVATRAARRAPAQAPRQCLPSTEARTRSWRGVRSRTRTPCSWPCWDVGGWLVLKCEVDDCPAADEHWTRPWNCFFRVAKFYVHVTLKVQSASTLTLSVVAVTT